MTILKLNEEVFKNTVTGCGDMKLDIKEKKDKSGIEVTFSLPASPICIGDVRKQVLRACKNVGIADEEAREICLAIIEAVTNSIRHSDCERLDVFLKLSNNKMLAKVIDDGKGFLFSEQNCCFPEADAQGGRGLPIICSLVDDFTVESGMNSGTVVVMVKYLCDGQESS